MTYLKPENTVKLKKLRFTASRVVEGFLYGNHKSPYSGVNIEFSEYRPYSFGDELKNIDWKLWGKTDKYYVKKYEEETNMRVWIMMDSSASMNFSSDKNMSKIEYSKILTASLSYLFLHQKDSVGVVDFSDNIKKIIAPSQKNKQFSRIVDYLENIGVCGETDLRKSFSSFASLIKKRGLIILISDFLDEIDNMKKALSFFRNRKNDVIVFHVFDSMERDFDFKEETLFVDPETGYSIQEDPMKIKKKYQRLFQKNCDKVKKMCYENNIKHYIINTSDNPVDILIKAFGK